MREQDKITSNKFVERLKKLPGIKDAYVYVLYGTTHEVIITFNDETVLEICGLEDFSDGSSTATEITITEKTE